MKFFALCVIVCLILNCFAFAVGSVTVGLYAPDRYEGIPEMCLMPMDFGYCRAKVKRYYFDMRRMKCTMFYWGGCAGNINNFKSLDECNKLCLDSFEADRDIGDVAVATPPVKERQSNYNSRKIGVNNSNNNKNNINSYNVSKSFNTINKNNSFDSLNSNDEN